MMLLALALAALRSGRAVWLAPAIMALLVYPSMFLNWHGDAIEIGRHSYLVGVLLRLAFWMLVCFIVDGTFAWVAARQRRSDRYAILRSAIQQLIAAALQAAQADGSLPPFELPEIVVEQPQRPEHGDFATPVALSLAKPLRRPPLAIAQAIVAHLPASEMLAAVELAGPGYVNLRLRAGLAGRPGGSCACAGPALRRC